MSYADCRTRRHRGNGGFTIVEFITAMTVTSIALLGVYGVFRHAMALSGELNARWQARHRAEAVARQMAGTLQRCVNLPDTVAIAAADRWRAARG